MGAQINSSLVIISVIISTGKKSAQAELCKGSPDENGIYGGHNKSGNSGVWTRYTMKSHMSLKFR